MEMERGAVSAQVVVASTAMLTMVLLTVQIALWQHSAHVVEAAANEAVHAARVQGSSATTGRAQAYAVLDQLGDGALTGIRVDVARCTTTARVTVSATTVQIIPLLRLPVSARAQAAVERFTSPGERP